MAVVAFPFSTCFTSEDVEDINSLQPCVVYEQNNNTQKPQARLDDNGDCSDGALAPSHEEPAPSNPSHETRPRTDEDGTNNTLEGTNDVDCLDQDDNDTNTNVDQMQTDTPIGERPEETMATSEEQGQASTDTEAEEEQEDVDMQGQESADADVEMKDQATFVEMYGGLRNLGNTCYSNSALQMIASLDRFVEQMEATPPPVSDDRVGGGSDSQQSKETLRSAFLDVMASLRKGDSVSPINLKKCLDERSCLFLGYHQQDSHEYLTTLLDLLDEDYKAKAASKETSGDDDMEQSSDDKDDDDMERDRADKSNNEEAHTSVPADQQQPSAEQQNQLPLVEDTEAAPRKLDDDTATTATDTFEDNDDELENGEQEQDQEQSAWDERNPTNPNASNRRETQAVCQSFSDLQPEGVERLLKARLLVNNTQEPIAPPSPPKCKLPGGRMNAVEATTVLFCDNDASTAALSIDTPRPEPSGAASKSLSPVESYLQTEVRVRLTCESCKYSRTHLENFLHLSLEIATDNEHVPGNVADGLRRFFAPESIELKCEKCFYEKALQTMEITRLPRALLLHFKRFIVEMNHDYTSITYRKNQDDVLFDPTLSFDGVLSEFVADDFSFPKGFEGCAAKGEADRSYQIRSVVNHFGSATSGHYTADAWRAYSPGGERRWNRFNDSFVSNISQEEAIRDSTRTAYMVMYELGA